MIYLRIFDIWNWTLSCVRHFLSVCKLTM